MEPTEQELEAMFDFFMFYDAVGMVGMGADCPLEDIHNACNHIWDKRHCIELFPKLKSARCPCNYLGKEKAFKRLKQTLIDLGYIEDD